MPFKSESQRRFMRAEHPALAAELEKEAPKGPLPEKVKRDSAKPRPAPRRRRWTGMGRPDWQSGR